MSRVRAAFSISCPKRALTSAHFCPHLQRGSNENTNGLLRQYFPKGTDLRIYSAATLQDVAQRLNNRPRKTLGWRTPAEVFQPAVPSNT